LRSCRQGRHLAPNSMAAKPDYLRRRDNPVGERDAGRVRASDDQKSNTTPLARKGRQRAAVGPGIDRRTRAELPRPTGSNSTTAAELPSRRRALTFPVDSLRLALMKSRPVASRDERPCRRRGCASMGRPRSQSRGRATRTLDLCDDCFESLPAHQFNRFVSTDSRCAKIRPDDLGEPPAVGLAECGHAWATHDRRRYVTIATDVPSGRAGYLPYESKR